ncbi:MBL fold metallo-hydrolase [Azospirillum rugosum]|uniref:Glyoxylase-like metal-dependent hydrolase (Beta-lactamase superfamily II) n=1 Tax=Azospirillum rugosum TaxID=416170 RepID=A0ABS4SUK8_9PROT|nr:MBL fold metallo-hydrolase [Azospirillum rugosum]MBP2296246.1 glyoxylase-like metal-dependent hydrolase (beta-lactamase superfamily II) [Azospirillum rugosum]MDQ0529767.1 glyoxylase-like metal-dependent hydrolase (beta-lactamase superfamily II) [Azospirillum rugosum]
MKPDVMPLFDEATNTVSYVVVDPATRAAALVDSVLDFDLKSGRTATASADRMVALVRERGLTVEWILETHIHADHLSAAPYLKERVGGRIGIGEHIREVQKVFRALFNMEPGFVADGRQFDHLFADGERFRIGRLEAQAIHTPGHTPADMTYVVGDAAFVGDTLFQPDYGTARCDFPGGDAHALYRSIRRILALPPATRVFTGHDYKAPGRDEYAWESTVAEQRARNVHVRDGVAEDEFVALRTARDRTLDVPKLILPSVQVNVRAGQLPPPEENGKRYLKIPIDAL